jgi:phosphoribosylformimino-5-aminoimidazole carboxamide ribotide isomerase
MEVIPAIDIRAGRCVQLQQGDFTRETIYGADPVAMAAHWVSEGATRLHVVDLDGARAGRPEQQELVLELIGGTKDSARIQVGGGLRRLADIDVYIEAGADRVVLGSAAIKDQETVVNACSRYPGRIVVAVDARGGKVTAEAWHEVSEVEATDLAQELEAAGATRFLYTDVGRDGMLRGPNLEGIRQFVERVAAPVIASGGIGSLEHLRAVEEVGAEACIVGTALYERAFTLREAIASSTIVG